MKTGDGMRLSMKVSGEDHKKTVKYILKNRLHLSERLVKKLKYSGNIFLNTIPVHVNAEVLEGDLVEALVELEEFNDAIVPEPLPIDILFEDEYLIAVNKPPGMVVHPTFSHVSGTVANALVYHLLCKDVRTLVRPVSRLDKDTSGIILFALNPFIQENLVGQMRSGSFLKEYVGLVHGNPEEPRGTINLPIERLPGSIMLRHVTADGSPSITHYEVLEQFSNAAYVKFTLETGRTHQIRVHCQASGHPLVGDTLYDLPVFHDNLTGLMKRQALHSVRSVITHPFTGNMIELEAPVPDDIVKALEILRNKLL